MPISKKFHILISACVLLAAGCTTSMEQMFPKGDSTMMDVWQKSGTRQQKTLDARSVLRRQVTEATDYQKPYSRDAVTEIRNQFPRLPNPDLVMYVYPHLTGTADVPVPGYSTVFPLFTRVQYALPGERVEDY